MRLILFFFMLVFFKMPKSQKDKRKLYKCVKKTFDDVPYLCIKFKNLSNKDLREVREEVNHLLDGFWDEPEPEYEEPEDKVRFEK